MRTLDELARALRALRSSAGTPSYAEIARRIGAHRDRTAGSGAARPSRATVYDCFRLGRRRIDASLVAEIARALGEPEERLRAWSQACGRAHAPREQGAAADVRAGLPEDDLPFVGRAAELARVLDAVSSTPAVIAIEGMAGVGKTRLAVRAARSLVARGTARRALFADLRGYDETGPPADPEAVLDGLLRELGVAPGGGTGVAERRASLEAALRAVPHVVVLDDAASAAQVTPLLPDAAPAVVLVTSRRALALPTTTVPLEPFPEPDSIALLGAVAGDDVVAQDPDAASALVSGVGHLPLAVGVAASRVASTTGWTLADHVAVLRERLRGQRVDRAVAVALEPSYAALEPGSGRLLRLLAAQPCPSLDVEAVAALADEPVDPVRRDLTALAAQHLVVRSGDERYGLHALVRAFGLDRSYEHDRPGDRRAAGERLARHVVARVWSAHAAVAGPARRPRRRVDVTPVEVGAAHSWLADNAVAAIALAGHGEALGRPGLVNDLAEGLNWWLTRHGRQGEAVRLATSALLAARTADDPVGVLRATLDLGQATLMAGDRDTAGRLLDEAAQLAEAADEVAEAMAATNARAIIHARSGELSAAAAAFEGVARHAESLGDRAAEARALDNLAIMRRKTGDLEAARSLHERAAAISADIGDDEQRARSLVNLAEVHLLLGRPEDAVGAAQAGVRLAEPFGSGTLGYGLDNLGSALARLGRTEEALDAYARALDRSREVADPHLEAAVLNNLGGALLHADADAAGVHYRTALHVSDGVADPFERARALAGLGDVALAGGDDVEARARWSEALEIFETVSAPEAASLRSRLAALR